MGENSEYRKKLISASEAAGMVKSGMWIDYGSLCGFPTLIDEKLAERASELTGVKTRAEHSPTQLPKVDPEQAHFIHNTWFVGHVERDYSKQGSCSYIPYGLSEGPRMYREWLKDEVDIGFVEVTPMDEHGYFNFGAAVTRQKASCEVAKVLVVEVNQTQPWVYGGYDEAIHISEVDYIVENDKYPIREFAQPAITKADEAIAGHLVPLIENGSTIQLGIGGMPVAIGKVLANHGLKDLGVHSEMFNDAMLDLIDAGVITCRKKNLNPGKIVHCFAGGTKRLYQFMNRNPLVAGFPVNYTNDPYVIAQNNKMIGINSALKIDLRGQVCSESAGFRQISGTGGQLEFTRGAYMSHGGKAFICLHATRQGKEGKLESTIMPHLQLGDMVTVPASEVSHVVTEFGVVNLKGKTVWQRAKLLISIAHPDFRAELEEAACKANIITKGTRNL